MNRRQFVQAGVSALFVPAAAMTAPAVAPGRSGFAWDHFFFDERFELARRLAQAASGATAPTPVQGDITATWTGGLGRTSLAAPLVLGGVTTESFYFCLKILLSGHSSVDARVGRIDRDLHQWTIRTNIHILNGTRSWQNHSHPV